MKIDLNASSVINILDNDELNHCIDGPSRISDVNIQWRIRNSLHNEDGPAIIYLRESDKAYYPEGRFYLMSTEYTKTNFIEKIRLMKR